MLPKTVDSLVWRSPLQAGCLPAGNIVEDTGIHQKAAGPVGLYGPSRSAKSLASTISWDWVQMGRSLLRDYLRYLRLHNKSL